MDEIATKRRRTVRPPARKDNLKTSVKSAVSKRRERVKVNGSIKDTAVTTSEEAIAVQIEGTVQPSPTHPSLRTVAGEVMVIGQGDVGQLGLGDEVLERGTPAPVVGMKESSIQVSCGGMHTVALSKEGKVYTWGCNDEGALGRTTSEGEEYLPGLVDKLNGTRVVQVSAGDSHTAALADDGRVFCWGVFRDTNGPFGLIKETPCTQPEVVYVSSFDRAVKIASGSDHLVILTEQGHLYTLGCAEQGQLGRVAECFSSRGGRKGVGLLLKPDVVIVPKKRGKSITKFTDVFCGSYHTFAYCKEDGFLYAWGLNNYGQLGTGDTDSKYQPHGIDIHKWFGEDCSELGDLQIAGGQHHTVLCCNGSVYVMGRKEYGRLGLGKEALEPHLPQKISALTNISSVAAGVACSFAVARTGEAYSWGMGTNMQLGNGSDEDAWTPGQMKGKNLDNCCVLSVSAGGQHTAMILKKNGCD